MRCCGVKMKAIVESDDILRDFSMRGGVYRSAFHGIAPGKKGNKRNSGRQDGGGRVGC